MQHTGLRSGNPQQHFPGGLDISGHLGGRKKDKKKVHASIYDLQVHIPNNTHSPWRKIIIKGKAQPFQMAASH